MALFWMLRTINSMMVYGLPFVIHLDVGISAGRSESFMQITGMFTGFPGFMISFMKQK